MRVSQEWAEHQRKNNNCKSSHGDASKPGDEPNTKEKKQTQPGDGNLNSEKKHTSRSGSVNQRINNTGEASKLGGGLNTVKKQTSAGDEDLAIEQNHKIE